MKGRFFLDSNILVYTFSRQDPEKRVLAQRLVQKALESQRGAISWQVVQEFLNVAQRKFPATFTPAHLKIYLDQFLSPLCQVYPSIELYRTAVNITERWQYSFYDALILASACESGSQTLYTEDLQHGQELLGLQIINPFLVS